MEMWSEVASLGLLLFIGHEKTLEVSSSEAIVVLPLDHFEEESWSVLHGFGEDLQEIALLVIVHQNLVLLKEIDILGNLDWHVWKIFPETVVVSIGNVEEIDSSGSHLLHSRDNILGLKSDVVNTGVVVVVYKLLNLRFLLTDCRLDDRHLDVFVVIGNHDRL